jgi:signal transduction histidine kinase
MKRWFSRLFILVLVMILVAMPVFAGPFSSISSAFASVLNIFKIFDQLSVAQFIGFLRLLIGILIFTIIYSAIGLVNKIGSSGEGFLSKNIAITISIILAIMTSIFIPGGILIAIGASYAAIFSFIVLGSLIGGALFLVVGLPTPNRFVASAKLVGLILISVILGKINQMIASKSVLTPMLANKYGSLPGIDISFKWVEMLSPYLWIALMFLYAWLIYMIFVGGDEGEASKKEWGSRKAGEFGEKIGEFGKKNWGEYKKKREKEAKRVKTKTLSEYIREEKELKYLVDIPSLVDNLRLRINNFFNRNIIEPNPWRDTITNRKNLGRELHDARQLFRRVKQNTYRQQREARRLIKVLINSGNVESAKEAELMKILEEDILKKHEKTFTKVNTAVNSFNKIKDATVTINDVIAGTGAASSPFDITELTPPVADVTKVRDALKVIKTNSPIIKTNINASIKLQKEAIKDLRGLVVEIKKYL